MYFLNVGQVEGYFRENEEGELQAYISYGKFGQAWLTQVTPSSFRLKWDSDIYQLFLADGSPEENEPFYMEFIDSDSFEFTQSGNPVGPVFVRNVTLADLPVVPWDPESCGPKKK